ncbi:MAG: response regulator [Thermoplasmata archaeon]|jgi:CheY-like chemotaxis protein/DNA-binding HxlR family transcriptional regulator
MRVLIVDEDSAFREELAAVLRNNGHTVTGVPSSAQAEIALEREEFDVMFTDPEMGRQSGMELLTHVSERWPRLLVVMLTARATVETAVQALQLGAFDYIRKPVRPNQIKRVLELVNVQLELSRAGARPRDPVEYANALAAKEGYEVLLISPDPVAATTGKVSHRPLDPENPSRIRDAVKGFAASREKVAVVIAGVEHILARHREEDIAALLEGIQAILKGKGPLAVGYDPNKITATGALTVRASIGSVDAHLTLESLASPIRRLVLRRLAEGPCTFTQTVRAINIQDTSKVAFHLRKLTQSGLVTHTTRQRYRLTPRGQGATQILSSIYDLDSRKGSGNLVFPSKPRRSLRSGSGLRPKPAIHLSGRANPGRSPRSVRV